MAIIFHVLLGLTIGSFFHVILLRIQREQKLFTGRSECDSCDYQLSWYDLIPILSYCLLGGRCRKCKSKISFSHVYAELIFGVGFGIIGWLLPYRPTLDIFMMYLAVSGLGIGAISDFAEGMVNTLITDIHIFCVIVLNLYSRIETGQYEAAGAYFLISVLAIGAAVLIAHIDRERHLGFGDYDNLILIFLCAGGQSLLKSIFFGSAIGIILYAIKPGKEKELPFVPLLYYGYLITLLI